MTFKQIHTMYLTACVGIVDKFEKKQGYEFTGWIGGVGGIASFIDEYYFNIDDLILDLETKQKKGFIFEWQQAGIDADAKGCKENINYKSYIMGLRYEDL